MGLGRVLVRSSPNVQAVMHTPTPFMAGPEQTFSPPSNVLPPPSETQALSWPAFLRGMAYVTGTVGMLPVTAYRGTEAVDPQPAVIRQPDPNQTPMAFWAGVVESLLFYGNSINIITSTDRYGFPITLKPIHPTLAAVRFQGNPMSPLIGAWYVAGEFYDPSQIWHIKSHLGRAGWPLGRGIMDLNGDAIAIGLALQSYAASYFNAGGMPTGVLQIHRPEITQAQADSAKQAWMSKYSGVSSIAVLNELTTFTPVSFRPVDSQMVESRQFSLIDAALMFGLPPSRLGANVGGGTYRNAQSEEVQSRNDAVAPWTSLLEEAASIELLPRGQHLQWDLSAALHTDTLSQYQAYQAALGGPGPTSAWLLVDEVRSRENLDPMAITAAEIDAEVEAAGVTVDEPAELAPTGQPAAPPVVGGEPVGNQAFAGGAGGGSSP
jgi:HK97 family phage portal protein